MFAFIRRHQFLAMAFMLLVIASFVVYLGPFNRNGGGSDGAIGTIDGHPISRQEYISAEIEAKLAFYFRYGRWPQSDSMAEQMGFDMKRQTLQRIFLNSRLQQQNIVVSDEAVAKQVAVFFRNSKSSETVADQYDNLVKNTLKPQGITDEDFRRFIRHDLGVQELSSTMSSSGRLIAPAVAESAYRYENERAEVQAVFFNSSNFVSQVTKIDPAALSQYYSNKVSQYRSPAKVQVDYVSFSSINYLLDAGKKMAESTNLTALIDAEYIRRGTNAFVDDNGKMLSSEKAKAKIKDDYREQLAESFAREAAYEFANKVSGLEPVKAENLKKVAGEQSYKVFTTEPFSIIDGPNGIEEAGNFSRSAFSLSAKQPFGEPVMAGKSFYVLAYNKSYPSQQQSLEAVHAKVEKDYTQYRAQQLARKAGQDFALAVSKGISNGKSFADLAKEQKQKVITLAPFARNARSVPELEQYDVFAGEFVHAAFSKKPGEVTDYVSAGKPGIGFVLFIKKLDPVDESRMKAELPDYIENLRSQSASDAYQDWFSRQFEAAAPNIPGLK